MDAETYLQTQSTLELLAGIISGLPLTDFIREAEKAHATGPILDPTLYRKAMDDLDDVIELAHAVLKVKSVACKRIEKEKARVSK